MVLHISLLSFFLTIRLLNGQADEVRSNKPAPAVLGILEVATNVFIPVYNNKLMEVLTKLQRETITLGEVDCFFQDLTSRPNVLRSELQMLARLRRDQGEAWVQPRFEKIMAYYRVQHQAQAAGELLKIRDAFALKGDFKPMEDLNSVVSKTY